LCKKKKKIANKGFWAEMLGVGDFYYELAVQIIEGLIFFS